MNKETFIALAKAYMRQERYEDEYFKALKDIAKKHKQEIDFLGLPMGSSLIMRPVADALGDDFSYFWYDCRGSFEKFNKGVVLADGSHPNVKSLEDLYDFAKEQGSIK